MKIDPRIKKDKRPLDCFDVDIAKQFIGKKGYFSHYIDNYADLKNTALGTLGSAGDTFDGSFGCIEEPNDNYYFEFFMPAEWVKPEESKKKYRPFSLNEFLNRYRLGNTVYFRRIGYKEVKCAMFVEYVRGESPEENQIVLGNMRYTLAYLFKNHELSLEDIWQPFGVEEKE